MLSINVLHFSLKEAKILGRKREYEECPQTHVNQASRGKTVAEK